MCVYNEKLTCLWIMISLTISLTLEPLEKVAQGFFHLNMQCKKGRHESRFFFFSFEKANMVLMKSPAVLNSKVL